MGFQSFLVKPFLFRFTITGLRRASAESWAGRRRTQADPERDGSQVRCEQKLTKTLFQLLVASLETDDDLVKLIGTAVGRRIRS